MNISKKNRTSRFSDAFNRLLHYNEHEEDWCHSEKRIRLAMTTQLDLFFIPSAKYECEFGAKARDETNSAGY